MAAALDRRASNRTAITALRKVGWSAGDAVRIVRLVVQLPYPGDDGYGPGSRGWRKSHRRRRHPSTCLTCWPKVEAHP